MIKPEQTLHRKFVISRLRLASAALFVAVTFSSAPPVFAVSKDMVQLQTQIQALQDAVARLQQSNDERMGAMKDLIQQSADSINKMGANVDAMRKQLQTQQEAQGGKVDQVSGQIQSLNDSVDEIKARIATLQKLMQDVQSQQQSMSAGMPQPTSSATLPPTSPTTAPPPTTAAPVVRKGKPSAGVPQAAEAPGPAVPPADELYKTALGDYMAAKYPLASSEFGDVVKYYPDNPLSGNSFYYQAEIEFKDGRYPAAIKAYDAVLEQYPDSNKVPVSHLHKGMALFSLKENEAGTRELRTLIQRFPNSPEAMQARSKLSGMGIPVTPKH
ncbi:tetratricopeptide repeat protein [Tunturiibacter gelidoferens]|jgi:TolA-binding protein|uniref:TolA-binding protein n=1 Tax=Tunturiibacter gelidiferens TaxID=3069689 RepID=A0A9X0U494_9BACT|nr:tetratricopeptide repeat protein [Edaphobacter lichenicola]MBB5329241.1 TolA-binding protein [Edaphobacter lichenicola]